MGPYTKPLWNQLSLVDDCILVDNRLAVPVQLRLVAMKRIHRGHPGQEAMLDGSNYLWWPHMHKETSPKSVENAHAMVKTESILSLKTPLNLCRCFRSPDRRSN